MAGFFDDLLDNHVALSSAVGGDLSSRGAQRTQENVHADLFIAAGFVSRLGYDGDGSQIGYAAAGDHALLCSSSGSVEGVIHQILALFYFGFRRTAHANHGYAAGQLSQPLLQLLTVVIAGALFDLSANLLDLVDQIDHRVDVVADRQQ